MKTKLNKDNAFTRTIDVTVPWASLKDNYLKEYNKQKKKFKIPGFRPGKAPDHIVKQSIGPAVEANFADSSLNQYYIEALKELDLIPINQAKITKLEFKENSDLKFSAVFEVRPEFKLPKYEKNIKIKIDQYTASQDDVSDSLDKLREGQSTLKEVDKSVMGNYIFADFQEIDSEGIPIIGSKIENQYIKLGEGNFNEEVSKSLVGKKIADKVIVNLPYGDGKKTNFEIEIKKIQEQILPELNDDFAKSIPGDFKNILDLKKELENNINKNLEDDFGKRLENKIVDFFVDKTKIEVPDSMLSSFLKNLFENEQKKDPNKKINEDDFNKEMKPYAEKNVKWLFIRGQLIHDKKIELKDSTVDSHIKDLISKNKEQSDDIKKYYSNNENRDNLKSNLLTEKLFDSLKDSAIIKTVKKSTNDLRKKANEK